MRFDMKCNEISVYPPHSSPVINDGDSRDGFSYAVLEGDESMTPSIPRHARFAVHVPDGLARVMFGKTVTVIMEVDE